MPTPNAKRGLAPGIIALLLAVALGAYLTSTHIKRVVTPPGCEARAGRTALPLDGEQAAIAATIAGVARQQRMPAHAVEVAYAAALQESKLHNLHYGDLDSVGVFQQRPSQGWGPARRLLDPVYASTRFFQVLATVPGYRTMPVYKAAQAVQRSADGFAYEQYQPMAAKLAAAFTGRSPHAVWCWSSGADPGGPALGTVRHELAVTFGPVETRRSAASGDAPTMVVRTSGPALSWSVASWLVTHAAQYRIHAVRCGGYQWRSSAGKAGWKADRRPLPAGQVEAG